MRGPFFFCSLLCEAYRVADKSGSNPFTLLIRNRHIRKSQSAVILSEAQRSRRICGCVSNATRTEPRPKTHYSRIAHHPLAVF